MTTMTHAIATPPGQPTEHREFTAIERRERLDEIEHWLAGANDRAMTALREKRNILLHDTDWWASSDLSISEAQTTYRQALRDLPASTPDPANPVWPTAP